MHAWPRSPASSIGATSAAPSRFSPVIRTSFVSRLTSTESTPATAMTSAVIAARQWPQLMPRTQ
jgi:hypothetical protein